MNEQAFIDAYNLFVNAGYRGGREEFKMLIATNPDAFNDSYLLFTQGGYNGSPDDFKQLIGFPEEPIVTEPKKKDDMESPLGDTSLVSQQTESETQPLGYMGGQTKPESLPESFPKPDEFVERQQEYMAKRQPEMDEAKRQESIQQFTDELTAPEKTYNQLINTVDASLIDREEEDVVPYMNDNFGKFGFVFEETGIGDKMLVKTSDGKHELVVDLDPFTNKTEIAEAKELRLFMNEHTRDERQPEFEDAVNQATRAKTTRQRGMLNPNGTFSTHNFEVYEEGGQFKVVPTLFPTDPDFYGTNPEFWSQLSLDEAKDLAEERGEVYSFKTKEEAEAFADGSYKEVSTADSELSILYKDDGLDYLEEQRKYNDYVETRDAISFIENRLADFNITDQDLTPEEKKRFGNLFVKGRIRDDYLEVLDELRKEEDELFDDVFSEEKQRLREKADLYLAERQNAVAGQAVRQNRAAKQYEDEIQLQSLTKFGVRAEELYKVEPIDEQQAQTIDRLMVKYQEAVGMSKHAAAVYDAANSYFDAKTNKSITTDLEDNFAGFSVAFEEGLKTGNASEVILGTLIGLTDLDDPEERKKASAEIAKYFSEMGKGQSRVLSRWEGSIGSKEAWDVIKSDPLEWFTTLAASSIAMMAPYGVKIVPASAGLGALGGGALGGLPGALSGFAKGTTAGFAATSLAMEYTNEWFQAAREEGYDLTNPMEVEQAFNDEDVWSQAKNRGLRRGIPIMLMDVVGGSLAGRMFKTGALAGRGQRLASRTAERLVFDPLAEGTGEYLAQKTVGDEVDWKEIVAEMGGGIGNNAPNMAANILADSRNANNIILADNLTKLDFMANESASSERISTWSTKQRKMGRIDADMDQRIQENVGIRREAEDIMNVGGNKRQSNAVKSRLMQLISARNELSSTTNRREIYRDKIKQINSEIAAISENNELLPSEQQTNLEVIYGAPRAEIAQYKIGNKQLTREQFIKQINKMSNRQLLRANLTVLEDEDMGEQVNKKIQDAIQNKETRDISDAQPTTAVQEVEEEVRVAPEQEVEEEVTEVSIEPKSIEQLGEENRQTFPKVRTNNVFLNNQETLSREDRAGVDNVIEEGRVSELPEENVSVANIVPTQKNLTIQNLEDTKDVTDVGPEDAIVVTEKEGKLYVIDGHHRLANEILKGNSNVQVKVFREPTVSSRTQPEVAEEVAPLTEAESEALASEVTDLEAMISPDTSAQFQLELNETSEERKQKLVSAATKLMEEVQPELDGKSQELQAPTMQTIPVVVTENVELANKVPKRKVSDLVNKRANLVMADQLKVDDELMGGAFFPLMFDTFGRVAWASIDTKAARKIIRGSIRSDFSLVYNMSPEAVDSNLATIDLVVDKINNLDNPNEVFNEIKNYLKGKKYGKKTEDVQMIAETATSLQDFVEKFSGLDVDTKAAIIKNMLPSREITPSTEIGKILKEAGITQEDIRSEISEQFVRDLPMGAITMVLEITDADGNKITNEADIDKAIMTREQQEAEGIRTHRNYPIYIRGRAVAMMEDTVPFWNISKSALNTIDAKIANVVKDKKGKAYSAAQSRSAEMRRASMKAASTFEVKQPTETQYTQFVNRLSKSFPNVEVVANQVSFNSLLNDLNAKALVNKNQKVYGAVLDGKLYLNPALENYNTPIHEFGHIWMNVAKELSPETYSKGIELIKDSEYVTQVKNNPAYKKVLKQMRADGATEQEINEYILEEALATAIGDKGESFATAAQERGFKNWLNSLFEFIKKLTGLSDMSAEQIQNLGLDEFLQGVVVDLLSENKLFKDAEVKSLGNQLQLMTSPNNTSMDSIIQVGRENGFSDASIREVLRGRGFKMADIKSAMEVSVDLYTQLPQEFARVEGGVEQGLKLFKDVRAKLSRFTNPDRTLSDVRQKAMDLMRANPIFQAQPEQIQQELLVGFDRTLGIRANINVRREIANIKKSLKERRLGQDNLRNAQIQIKNFIRQSLPKSKTYTQTQINKLVNLITKTNLDNFQAQTERVLEIVEQQRNKMKLSLINDINKLVKQKSKAAVTDAGKRRTRGLDAQGQSFFNAIAPILRGVSAKVELQVTKPGTKKSANLEKIVDKFNEMLNRFNSPETQARVNEAIEKQEAGEKLTTQEQKLVNEALAYDTFNDLDTMSLEEVQEMFDMLKGIRAESILRLKSRRLARASEAKRVSDEVTNQIKETNPELFDEEGNLLEGQDLAQRRDDIINNFKKLKVAEGLRAAAKTFKYTKAGDFIRNALNIVKNLKTLTNALDRAVAGKTLFTDNLHRKLNRMEEQSLIGLFETKKKIDNIAKSVGFTDGFQKMGVKPNTVRVKLGSIDAKTYKLNGKNVTLSSDQLLRVYALSLNDTQRGKLEAQGIDEQVISDIKDTLGPELISFADGVVDFLSNQYYESVNEVYAQANDVNLAYVTNYFPTKTVQKKIDAQQLTTGDFYGVFTADSASALKERTDVTGKIDLKDADFTGVLDNHIKSMEKFKAYALGTKEMNEFFRIPAVNTLIQELGVDNILKKMVNLSINPNAASAKDLEFPIVQKLQVAYTGFALAFKAVQIIKQATSFVNAYSQYSYFPADSKLPNVVKSAVDLPMFMVDMGKVYFSLAKDLVGKTGAIREAMELSASFKNRVEQGVKGDVYGLESGSKTFKPLSQSNKQVARFARGFQTAGAAPTIIGDVLGVIGYMANYKRNIANGMSKAEAVEAFNDYNETQQSRRGADKSLIQLNSNVFVRTLTMFGSTVFLQINKVMQSGTNIIRSLNRKKVPSKKDIRDFYLNLAVANVLFVGVSNLAKFIKGDEEDKEEVYKRMLEAMTGANLLYQIPFIGNAAEEFDVAARIISGVKGEEYKAKRKFGTGGVNPFISVANKVTRSMREDKSFFKTYIQPILEIRIGAQIDPIVGTFNSLAEPLGIVDMTPEEYEDNVYDAVGISPSYRPGRDKEKKPKPMTKTEMKKFFPQMYEDLYGPNGSLTPTVEAEREMRRMRRELLKEIEEGN